MKGFKKDGKFRPTGNKSKSSLKKSDLRKKKTIEPKRCSYCGDTGHTDHEKWAKRQEEIDAVYDEAEFRKKHPNAIDINELTAIADHIAKNRKKETLGKDYHLYRIDQFESSEDNGDSQQWGVIKARNYEDVEKYIEKEFFVKGADIENNGDQIYVSTPFDENGNELTRDKAFKLQDKEGDDAVSWVDDGFVIEEDDEQEESFHTIYGGNDFIDLLDPENSGKTSEENIKEKGGVEKAFFQASGQGFEQGNKENDFNLNTGKVDLYDPKTNPKPTGRGKQTLDDSEIEERIAKLQEAKKLLQRHYINQGNKYTKDQMNHLEGIDHDVAHLRTELDNRSK